MVQGSARYGVHHFRWIQGVQYDELARTLPNEAQQHEARVRGLEQQLAALKESDEAMRHQLDQFLEGNRKLSQR
jgi:phage shock protein A